MFQVIERHFTLDKRQKGTDHKLSLEPSELRQLIARIRTVEGQSLPTAAADDQVILDLLSPILSPIELTDVKLAIAPLPQKSVLECEMPCRLKLGKSLVYRNSLQFGTTITEDDICAKVSEPFGISAERFDEFIGRKLSKDVTEDENLNDTHF